MLVFLTMYFARAFRLLHLSLTACFLFDVHPHFHSILLSCSIIRSILGYRNTFAQNNFACSALSVVGLDRLKAE